MALHFVVEAASTAEVGSVVTLEGAEAKHAAVVRRLRIGEVLTLGDGNGVWLDGVAVAVAPARVDIEVTGRSVSSPPSPRLVLVQALAKGDRDELAVQASCELGIDEIVPWQASRSISRWEGAKAAKGRERWQSIVREAAKQAHRSWIPQVEEIATTGDLAKRAGTDRVLILDPGAETRLSAVVKDDRDIVLVVGPEGGIAPEELDRLVAAGAERVLLGDTVLRTSTAGPAAIAVLSAALGRW